MALFADDRFVAGDSYCAAAAVCARIQGLEGKTRRWHTQAAQLCPTVRAGIAPYYARDGRVVGVRLWHRLRSLAGNGRPRHAGFARVEATGRRTRTAAQASRSVKQAVQRFTRKRSCAQRLARPDQGELRKAEADQRRSEGDER